MAAVGAVPSDSELRREMRKLVQKVDVDTITTKQFIALLSKTMGGVDLTSKKKFIKMNLGAIIDAMEEANEKSEEESGSEDDESSSAESESEEEVAPPPKKKVKKSGGGEPGKGLTQVKELSKALSEFLGRGTHMARTEVVKALWEYIREHNLQNPSDKREILLDDAMKDVFGVDRFSMFQMNKYVGAHIHPFKPVDLTPSEPKPKKKKTPVKKETKKGAKGAAKPKSNAGFQAPYRLSEDMISVVGTDILPRPQVTKLLWEYIRNKGLQNPEDKRQIICDKKFAKVMGGEKTVTMFSMNKHISKHLLEKVDPSLYTPREEPPKPKVESEVEEDGDKASSSESEDDESESEDSSSSSSSSTSSDADSDSDDE